MLRRHLATNSPRCCCCCCSLLPSAVVVAAAPSTSNYPRHQSSPGKAQWGDWSTDASTKHEYDAGQEHVNRTNNYDPKQFMSRGRRGATVIVREKPVVQSWSQRAIDYFKPQTQMADSWVDPLQLVKLVLYLIIPILMLVWWRGGAYEKYPDYWEQQAAQLQAKPLNTEGGKQKYTYNDVMGSMEDKRNKAMSRQGYSEVDQKAAAEARSRN